MFLNRIYIFVIILTISSNSLVAQFITDEKFDWENGRPEGCTAIMVGKKASFDGSVMNSHTDDSHRDRAWIKMEPAKNYLPGSKATMTVRTRNDSVTMPAYTFQPIGEIPQVAHTYAYINSSYPCMNEHQLAVGESTFGGRASLKSDRGLIDCYQLNHLIVQRCKTAREAIELTRQLLKEHGWNDYGECLTLADTKEVWLLEIVGPGKGNLGAVWAAQRVPDDHISVVANASRIREIDLNNPDYYRASDNVFQVAADSGWWDKNKSEFEFCYAYDPDGRNSFASRRREWRVLSLAAPSLSLHPNSENYPFSVNPDSLITKEKMVSFFKDYYQGTPYDMRKNITWVNPEGKTEISPLASPFMPYDMNKIFKVNGGWNELGERTIARWYTMYGTITQSRDWLPDEVGGVVWFAWDNIATSIYIPIYPSITHVPTPYSNPGRVIGFSTKSAWWAFNRLATLASQRWGDMHKDVDAVWAPLQKQLFDDQAEFESNIIELLKNDRRNDAINILTIYTTRLGLTMAAKAWEIGNTLWTKYDEKF